MTQSQAIVVPARWASGGGKEWVIVERILITSFDFFKLDKQDTYEAKCDSETKTKPSPD
jgi:hypothetical protein